MVASISTSAALAAVAEAVRERDTAALQSVGHRIRRDMPGPVGAALLEVVTSAMLLVITSPPAMPMTGGAEPSRDVTGGPPHEGSVVLFQRRPD